MNTNYFLLIMLIVLTSSCQTETTAEQKIEEIIELSGFEVIYPILIENLVNNQKENFTELLTEDFFQSFKTDLNTAGCKPLLKKLMPIYSNEFSEKELEELLILLKQGVENPDLKLPNHLATKNEIIEKKWKETIINNFTLQLNEKINIKKFETNHDLDCSSLKEGKFFILYHDGTTIDIERGQNQQTETHGDNQTTSKIEWISDCRYKISFMSANDDYSVENPVIINVYEILENSYKYIGHEDGKSTFIEGDVYFYQE